MKNSTINLSIHISSVNDSLEWLTDALGIQPSSTAIKGKVRRNGYGVYKEHMWNVQTGHVAEEALDEGLAHFIYLIEKHLALFRELSEKGVYLGFGAVPIKADMQVGLVLDNRQLAILANAGFVFDFDDCEPPDEDVWVHKDEVGRQITTINQEPAP